VSAHRGELGCFALGKAGCFWLDFGVVNVVFLWLGESGYNGITCGAYTSPVYSTVAGKNQRIQKHQRNSRFFQCAANNFIFHR
jgi:hypothetical protein